MKSILYFVYLAVLLHHFVLCHCQNLNENQLKNPNLDNDHNDDQDETKGNNIRKNNNLHPATDTSGVGNDQSKEGDPKEDITGEIKTTNSWEAYRVLLETQRKAHMEVIKHLLTISQTEKQYDLLNVVSTKIIEVLDESKIKLLEAEVSPDGQFPENEDHRDYLSKLIQNTLLYGDLALRFPTFIHRQFDRKKQTRALVKWCFDYVNKAGITNGTSAEQTLHLASQELNIIDREDSYQNPFLEEAEFKLSQLVKEELKKQKKKAKKRGPRLSGKKTEL